MTEEFQNWLTIILGAVALAAVIGWILTYLRKRGTYFVVGEDSLKVTYYFADDRTLGGMSDEQILENESTFIVNAEADPKNCIQTYVYPITGEETMVSKNDTYQYYARRIHSMKPPHMRLIAIQIELIRK